MKRPGQKQVKDTLFIHCGKIDMYSMKKYDKKKLQLHHEPVYEVTKHTVYEESFLLTEKTHKEMHDLLVNDTEEYNRRMDIIKENKRKLELRKIGKK